MEFKTAKMWETFVKVFGGSSVLYATVFQWHSGFAAGEESIEDAELSGRLETEKINENIARVAAVLKDDHRASCRLIEESIEGTKNIVHHILSDDLKKRKLCTICAACVDSRTMGTEHCSYKRLNHAPYSPDLSPPESFAFPKLKIELKGDRYVTIN